MLQHRELIRAAASLVEEAGHQIVGHVATGRPGRTDDGEAPLFAAQPRRQVLALVDRLGQPVEYRAVADEIGAHGQHDENRELRLLGARQQQRDESVRLVDVALTAKAEDFFKLIDGDKQVGLVGQRVGLQAPRPGRAARAAAGRPRGRGRSRGSAPSAAVPTCSNSFAASRTIGLPPGRITANFQRAPSGMPISPVSSAAMRPARTSDDLPQPDVPTTARKRDVFSRRTISSV